MKLKPLIKQFALIASLAGTPYYSANAAENFNWFIGAGLTGGGEDLATVEVEYFGDNASDEDITSGGLISFAGGIVLAAAPTVDLQFSFGYHSHSIYADDDNVSFTRWPLEALIFAKERQHRLGGGMSYHMNPELDLEDVNRPVFEFDDALGWVIEYGYSLNGWDNGGIVFGARYMFIEYELESADNIAVSGDKIDGNHFGININYLF